MTSQPESATIYEQIKQESASSPSGHVPEGGQYRSAVVSGRGCVLLCRRSDCLRIIFLFQRGCLNISAKELQINEEIRDRELRIIGSDGEQLGIMSAAEALKIAEEKNLDLVKIAPQAKPPVCKIMDYGKYRFEKAKREKEARKNQRIVEIKEIRLSVNIDTHDFDTKVGHAKRFLADGNKVKVSIRFRGREMAHTNLGLEIMDRFAQACAESASVEKAAKLEGRSMLMFLVPKATK